MSYIFDADMRDVADAAFACCRYSAYAVMAAALRAIR